MAFDLHKNLAVSTVAFVPSPPASGTLVQVQAGHGARFPAPPFNVTIWPALGMPDPATAEIARCTNVGGDILTIARAQESTAPRTIATGDLIALTITMKTITDIEAGNNFPALAVSGLADLAAGLTLSAVTTGRPVIDFWNVTSGNLGQMFFANDGGFELRRKKGGNFAFLTFTAAGDLTVPAKGNFASLDVLGGMRIAGLAGLPTAGAGLELLYVAGVGTVQAYDRTGAAFRPVSLVGASVDLSIGGVPAAVVTSGSDFVVGGVAAVLGGKQTIIYSGSLRAGLIVNDSASVAGTVFAQFGIGGTGIGSITRNAATSAVLFNTTSDARLKNDLGPATDLTGLRRLRVHDFTWKTGGGRDRNVFAQEAFEDIGRGVTPGGDLSNPWMVDKSAYVPDLIVGWQDHDARIVEIERRLTLALRVIHG